MKSYGLLERTVAKSLEAFPFLRYFAKTVYHRLNYLYFAEQGFQIALHPQVQLQTPPEWAGMEPEARELFFGYYDKSPWSLDVNRAVFHCLSRDDSQAAILVYDREKHVSQIIGVSSTWNYQQGSMAQWVPSSEGQKVIFNDLVDGNLAARIISVEKDEETVVPWPIQTLHPNGKEALSLNYKRLECVSEYGYSVVASNFSGDQSLEEDGVWRVDLASGQRKLMFNLATLIAREPHPDMADSQHQVNHAIYSPRGTRFVFMHRWTGSHGRFSRLYVANSDGSELRILMDDRMVSHYYWRDEDYLLAWARTKEIGDRYYLINVSTGERQIVGDGVLDVYGDGHPSFSPNRHWLVTDTYPNRARQRYLLLYEAETNKVIEIGRFFAPWQFDGPKRCDLHPRWSPDGTMISIDSAHEGRRMTYMLDVSSIVGVNLV